MVVVINAALQKRNDLVQLSMLEDELHYSRLRAAAQGLAIPNSTRQIVEEIVALIPKPDSPAFTEVVSA